MPTKLEKTIVREVEIDGESYTIAISPEGVRLSRKRFRSGVALTWKSLWNEGSRISDKPAHSRQG
jgi:hypothetical protein